MMRGVIHVHSDYSSDGRDPLARLRAWAIARHLRFVALSDHAEDFDGDRYARFVAECAALSDNDVTLIPGLEFRFVGLTGLHLLALGLTRWIVPSCPEEFVARTHGVTGLTILAHPALCRYEVPMVVRDSIDAVEVWNAKYNTRYLPDPRAIRLLHELQRTRPALIGTAGLDQHDAANDRGIRISVAAGVDPLAEIRAGRFRNHGVSMSFGPTAAWPPYGLPMLEVTRSVYDRIERMQERMAKRAHARRSAAKRG